MIVAPFANTPLPVLIVKLVPLVGEMVPARETSPALLLPILIVLAVISSSSALVRLRPPVAAPPRLICSPAVTGWIRTLPEPALIALPMLRKSAVSVMLPPLEDTAVATLLFNVIVAPAPAVTVIAPPRVSNSPLVIPAVFSIVKLRPAVAVIAPELMIKALPPSVIRSRPATSLMDPPLSIAPAPALLPRLRSRPASTSTRPEPLSKTEKLAVWSPKLTSALAPSAFSVMVPEPSMTSLLVVLLIVPLLSMTTPPDPLFTPVVPTPMLSAPGTAPSLFI